MTCVVAIDVFDQVGLLSSQIINRPMVCDGQKECVGQAVAFTISIAD